jgi:hypothetical protein
VDIYVPRRAGQTLKEGLAVAEKNWKERKESGLQGHYYTTLTKTLVLFF